MLWRKEFDHELGDRRVHGWAGIMAVGGYARAGFSVFRRRRLIEGSVDDAYKPHAIFGSPNSFTSQRVVGEIFVEGFNVSHTKDGIQWDEYEAEVLQAILRQLDAAPLSLLDQAEGYRARRTGASLPVSFGSDAIEATASELAQPSTIEAIRAEIDAPDEAPANTWSDEASASTPPVSAPSQTRVWTMNVSRDGRPWQIELELVRDVALPFYSTSLVARDGGDVINVRLNLEHEFSVQHINGNEQALQPVLRLVAALALGEKQARDAGVKNVGVVRQNANEILAVIARHQESK